VKAGIHKYHNQSHPKINKRVETGKQINYKTGRKEENNWRRLKDARSAEGKIFTALKENSGCVSSREVQDITAVIASTNFCFFHTKNRRKRAKGNSLWQMFF